MRANGILGRNQLRCIVAVDLRKRKKDQTGAVYVLSYSWYAIHRKVDYNNVTNQSWTSTQVMKGTIYSTLIFINIKNKLLSNKFQPLWIKAVEIVLAKSFDMAVRLGGIHTFVSFLGSLGRLDGWIRFGEIIRGDLHQEYNCTYIL